MNILIVGSGGREHALAWKIGQSPLCTRLYCAPGNAGISACAELVDIKAEDAEALVAFSKKENIDFVVIGPEGPLVLGLADQLSSAGILVFGPSQSASRLEGSKAFTKDLCKKYNIPTAAYGRFTDLEKAKQFILSQKIPVVVKADGLAAGKGVVIAQSHEEAINAAQDMLSGNAFGAAGAEVVIEEFLDGEELSYFALTDGHNILAFNSAQDHKRVFDGDQGPNTGGMGAYSPARLMTPALEEKIISSIIEPTIIAMQTEGALFKGVLYAGLMIVNGEPMLIEYNARFGDPECQVLMRRLKSDLLPILLACAQERLEEIKHTVAWHHDHALCVVMAAQGYPGSYLKNTIINGLQEAAQISNVTVFHAGTQRNEAGDIISIGGRVLGVTATGKDLRDAQKTAYKAVECVQWPEGFCRSDIGWRAL